MSDRQPPQQTILTNEIIALRAERDELAAAILAWKDNEGRTDLLRAAARKLRRIGAPNA